MTKIKGAHVCLLAVVFGLCLSGLSVGADPQGAQRRAFQSGGPENLVMVGYTTRDKLMSAGRSGSGGFEFSTTELYQISLYLDEEGARKALTGFRGQNPSSLADDTKFQQAILDSDFPKMAVLKFAYKRAARDIREDIAERLGRGVRDSGKFLNYFRTDFQAGDEVLIRFDGRETLRTTVAGKDMPEIQNGDLSRGLLKMWIDRRTISDIGPLLP